MTEQDDDWVLRSIRESRARTTRLSDTNHDKVLAVAHQQGWTYDEALNYVVGLGLGIARAAGEEQDT